jgi:FtsP/CotA-like multicopper oxidase with cupredoxin domain
MPKSILITVGLFWLVCAPASAQVSSAQAGGKIRTYYIAADEIDWEYASTRIDQITGEKYHFENDPASKGTLDPNSTSYRKALFREYTDASFSQLKPRDPDWVHLGILGPLLRAEVGDTIKVVFKNNASRPYSIHPHGVFYAKNSEGAGYLDNTTGVEKADDAVVPGSTYAYVWPVPERAGPAEGDGSTAFWLYHSHVDEGKDINSGLIGPIIITRRGMARADASPKDVDREFVRPIWTL